METKTVYAVGIIKKGVATNPGFSVNLSFEGDSCGVVPVFETEDAAQKYCDTHGLDNTLIFPVHAAK